MTSAIVIAAAAVGGLAAPAGAEETRPGFCSSGRMFADHEGSLVIDAMETDRKPVVHLRDKKTGQRVATVSEFRTDRHEDMREVAFISQPLKLPAIGIYGLEIGSEADHVTCGDFDYRLRTEVKDMSATDQVSLDNLKTTVSAVVTTFDPRTAVTAPLANTKVTIKNEAVTQEATTDAQGKLTSPFTFRGTETSSHVSFGLQATSDMDGKGASFEVPAVPQRAVIAINPASQPIVAPLGAIATVKGQALRIAADGTRRPVPEGTPLTADLTGAPVTKADGRFERKVKVDWQNTVETSWANGRYYPWLEFKNHSITVNTTGQVSFSQYKAAIDSARRVTFTGVLGFKPAPSGIVGDMPVTAWYSVDGKTGWKKRGTFTADFSTPFTHTLPGNSDGYWRLSSQYAMTEPVRLTRTATTFTYFNAAPEPVRKGQTFTIKGTLQHQTPAKAYGGQTVLFYFRPTGSKGFIYQGHSVTAANGTFVHPFKADRTGTWIARYRDADGKHFNAESRQDDLVVNP
ncbi:hypothetical protein ACFVX6_16975 [Streptomyces sp. NPDC058289]|uniref:hypothetical protein n=1 Tax=Streptomyces sp. NPDC058289 TaxID=3346425 RepID=UPI0036EA16F1